MMTEISFLARRYWATIIYIETFLKHFQNKQVLFLGEPIFEGTVHP